MPTTTPRFPLVRIANDSELADALVTVDDLLTREMDAGQEAYFDTLSALIHVYETEHHSIPDATPAEVLRELADANGLTGAAIAQRTGIAPSTVSSLILSKNRVKCVPLVTVAWLGVGCELQV